MTKKLSSHKRLLTSYCKKLETALSRFKGEKLETLKVLDEDRTPGYEKECRKRLQEGLGVIEACTSKIEQLWKEYGDAFDRIEDLPKSESDDYEVYSALAEEALSSALDYTVILEGRLRAFKSGNGSSSELTRTTLPKLKRSNYQLYPFQLLRGNTWDWDNFWILFTANKAVELLISKYGNHEDLVKHLIDRLEKTTSRSTSTKDLRVLLELLQAIISQLQDKGEPVDGQLLVKQVLSKFSDRLQRRVLERKYSMEGSFHMETLFQTLEDIISKEEQIALYTAKDVASQARERKETIPKEQVRALGLDF
ncbi:hypothetical protein COOONC_28037 [Cooperia oncophora]